MGAKGQAITDEGGEVFFGIHRGIQGCSINAYPWSQASQLHPRASSILPACFGLKIAPVLASLLADEIIGLTLCLLAGLWEPSFLFFLGFKQSMKSIFTFFSHLPLPLLLGSSVGFAGKSRRGESGTAQSWGPVRPSGHCSLGAGGGPALAAASCWW